MRCLNWKRNWWIWKPFCLLFDSSLAVQQTNTYSGNSALLKFQCLLLFFSEQHPILLDRNDVHKRCLERKPMHQEQKASNCYVPLEYVKALNDYQCSWTRTRVVVINCDWRHCCHCSWRKRRGATSMERGQVVFPARDCANVPFPLLKLNTYSNRFMSRVDLSRWGNLCFNRVHAW